MITCSCIADNSFDFVIEHKLDYFLFTDISKWVTSTVNNKQETFEFTIVNGKNSKKFIGKVNGTIKIEYCDLPSDNLCGSDGVYEFIVDSCGIIFKKCEAILPSIFCAYSKLLIRKPEIDYIEKVLPLFIQIEYIKANANICNITSATEHFKLAVKMIENLNCKCK